MTPDAVTLHYSQETDSCGEGDLGQELEIEVCDAGGGHYLVLRTARWAIEPDGIDDLADALRRALAMCAEGRDG
jgi:hypothetical protein